MALNFALQIINFCVAWAGSWKIGAQFPHLGIGDWNLGMPMIVGYMAVGFLCGQYMTGMLFEETITLKEDWSVASIISNLTLSFIALSAGAELHAPSLGVSMLKEIMSQIFCMGILMVGIGTPLIFLAEPLLPSSLASSGISCQWTVAFFVAVIQWAGSVIEVLAIYHETGGKGPVTQLMIGTTMLLDMVVLVWFAIAQNIVVGSCPLEDTERVSAIWSICMIIGSILLWALCGVLLGNLLQACMRLRLPGAEVEGSYWNLVKPALVVITGATSYFSILKLNILIPRISSNLGLLRVDPLLVCVIASSWVIHTSPEHRDEFRKILSTLAPLLMPPFFTLSGAALDLKTILKNWVAVPVLFSLRFVALALGSFLAAWAVSQKDTVKKYLWMTLQSQSGVTLGLVAQMQVGLVGQQEWAKGTAAIITGCVVLNQLVGPTLCRHGITIAGEAHQTDDEEVGDGEVNNLKVMVDMGTDPDMSTGIIRPYPRARVDSRVSQRSNRARAWSAQSWGSSATGPVVLMESETTRTQKAMSSVIHNPESIITGAETAAAGNDGSANAVDAVARRHSSSFARARS